MAYFLDANVFIAANNRTTASISARPSGTGLWPATIPAASSVRVGHEVQALGDDLSDWAAIRGQLLPPA